MVRRWVRWLVVGSGVVMASLLVLVGVVYANTSSRMSRHYDVTPEALPIPRDAASVERGKHVLYSQAKCGDCHGADLAGGIVVDDPAVGTLVAPNITPAGVTARFGDADWIRAIRHGVAPDGRALVVMPSYEYARLGKDDLAAMVAYLEQVPPAARELPEMRVGPVGRALVFAGLVKMSAEIVDHTAPIPVSPPPAPTAAYGEYMVRSGCVGCHGDHLSGGKLPGTPPDWLPAANLTPSGHLGRWTAADFRRALRTGKRPDGSAIGAPMPIAATKLLTDMEIDALWAYLQTVPPRETGTF